MRALSAAIPALALSSVGALVVLACPLPARVPLVAMVGQWAPHAVETHAPVAPVVSGLALAALVWLACRAWGEGRRLLVEVRDAIGAGALRQCRTEVVVVEDPTPQAHALGVGMASRGRIVVSSGLVQLLDAEERVAVIAHERAHNHQRHALVLTAARLSAALNPLLAPIVGDLRFALERSADEAAAAVSSRDALASAIARTALATAAVPAAVATSLALHRRGVAERVAALLDEPPHRTRAAWALLAVAVIAATAMAWALHDTERFFEAARLWSQR